MSCRRSGAVALLLAFLVSCSREPELPVIATVPAFALTNQDGRPFAARDLDGKVWIAAFLFTRCTSICPMLTSQMVNFQRRLGPTSHEVPFVAFSVDPEYDTPDVLRRFAAARGATRGFTFLTGDTAAVRSLATDGFKVAIGETTTTPSGAIDVLHAQHLMLVDRRRRLRGFYRTDAEGLENLQRDVDRLLAEPR